MTRYSKWLPLALSMGWLLAIFTGACSSSPNNTPTMSIGTNPSALPQSVGNVASTGQQAAGANTAAQQGLQNAGAGSTPTLPGTTNPLAGGTPTSLAAQAGGLTPGSNSNFPSGGASPLTSGLLNPLAGSGLGNTSGSGNSGSGGGSGSSGGGSLGDGTNPTTAAAAGPGGAGSQDPALAGSAAGTGGYSGGGGGGSGGGGSKGGVDGGFGSLLSGLGGGGAGGAAAGGGLEFGKSVGSSALLNSDPADYFSRLDPSENLFRVVTKKYTEKATGWSLAAANSLVRLPAGAGESSAPMNSAPSKSSGKAVGSAKSRTVKKSAN